MLDIEDKHILKFIPNYEINLITPSEIVDSDFDKFKTELKELLLYIKYSKDKKRLQKVVYSDDTFKNLSRKTAVTINTLTNSDLNIGDREEYINMCEAIKGIRDEGRAEGKIEVLKSLVERGIISISQAAKELDISIEEFQEKINTNIKDNKSTNLFS